MDAKSINDPKSQNKVKGQLSEKMLNSYKIAYSEVILVINYQIFTLNHLYTTVYTLIF